MSRVTNRDKFPDQDVSSELDLMKALYVTVMAKPTPVSNRYVAFRRQTYLKTASISNVGVVANIYGRSWCEGKMAS